MSASGDFQNRGKRVVTHDRLRAGMPKLGPAEPSPAPVTFADGVSMATGSLLINAEDPAGREYARVRYAPVGAAVADMLTGRARRSPRLRQLALASAGATAAGYERIVDEWRYVAAGLLGRLEQATGRPARDIVMEIAAEAVEDAEEAADG